MLVSHSRLDGGFSLIELIIGIVVFAVALSLFAALIVPQASRSADPILQVRATELAQSMMNEISSKSFDQQSSRVGGEARCNENANPCTASNSLGADGSESRTHYNDVDDYNGLDEEGADIKNSFGTEVSLDGDALYQGFRAQVVVYYDDNMDGVDDAISSGNSNYVGNTKYIQISITSPSQQALIFSSYRSNY
ncbi:type IV pilus modification PilV family protein [Flavobacterium sp. W21_SRS_FM6]|uniref:type IV pilus modification PilV family protein n=1 Tax=Flavobacterium sp. W21_SRS_FM6 TaxID=3240268 RepID=UPI003F91779F